MDKAERIEQLMESGFEAVNNFETKKAIKIGNKLKKLRHTSAFEILALAYLNNEETKKAIEILKEGVGIAPNLWILWQLLGNTYSVTNEYFEAQKCYRKALECEEHDTNSILYNSALAYKRAKDEISHKKQIDKISTLELHKNQQFNLLFLVTSEKVSFLVQNGHIEEACNLAEECVNLHVNKFEYRTEFSQLLSAYAEALWERQNIEAAKKIINEAIKLDKSNNSAAWLIREIDNLSSSNAKYFSIIIMGVWPEPFEGEELNPGFFTTYKVVADDIDQSLLFIKRFEPSEVHSSIKVEESEILDENPNVRLGVYETTGYDFFPGKEI